jgi:hypothetical protein
MQITWNGKVLLATLLFRLLFGGYVVGMDQYSFNDLESAITVVVIYGLIALFATLFLFGQRIGLMGIIGLDGVFLVLNSVFLVLSLGQITDPGMHSPVDNWWATILRYVFTVLTLIWAIRTYKETKKDALIKKT